MTADTFDQYVPGDSSVHRLAPVTKTVALLCFVLCVVLCPSERWAQLAVFAAVLLVLAAGSRVPARWLLVRLTVLAPFLLFAAVALPFVTPTPGETPWVLFPTPLTISPAAAVLLAAVSVKSVLCALAVALVLATTGFHGVVGALQRLRVPTLFVSLLTFAYRYLFVLWEECVRMQRACASRAPRQRTFARLRTVGHLSGSLFLRSYERAERVANAMVARGFDGTLRLAPQPAASPGQWIGAALFAAGCAFAAGWRG